MPTNRLLSKPDREVGNVALYFARLGSARHFAVIFLLSLVALFLQPSTVWARLVAAGTFTGNGVDDRVFTGLGFRPEAIIIKASNTSVAVLRTASMSGDSSKRFNGTVEAANLVQSLDADGFTLGNGAEVNASSVTYEWIAFDEASGYLKVGTYAGNGVNNRALTGVGFSPEAVMLISNTGEANLRLSVMPSQFSAQLNAEKGATDRILSLDADGFTVGSGSQTNASGSTYYYVAWNVVAKYVSVGTHTGNGTVLVNDNRNITGVGFSADYVLIKGLSDSTNAPLTGYLATHKTVASGASTDSSNFFAGSASAADNIQALQADGFQVGNSTSTNASGSAYYWLAVHIDAAPVITSNGGGASASINTAENTTAVTTVTATDAEGDTLTYSISGGADQAKFSINSSTGVLTFASAPDYETPTDVGADNVYDVIVAASDGSLTDTQAIAVTVTNVNEAPVITSNGGGASASVNVAENTTAVTTVTATDVDASTTLTYSLSGGADQAKFSINSSTGVLTFASAPDYETPTDVGANNVYDVVVQVSDGSLTDTQALAVTITDANEAPVLTSDGGGVSASVNVAENTTAVTTVTATDVDASTTLTYSLSGGADQAKFSINSSTGVLTFASAPDYETPTDVGANNVYDVVVQVSDGSLTDTQALAVTITDANEAPVITSNGGGASASVNVAENTTAVTTVTATDPEGATLTYSLNGGADQAKFSLNSSTGVLTFVSAPDYETPTDVGADNVYDVIVRISDGSLTDTQAIAVTVTNANEAPVLTSDGGGASASFNVAENTTAVTTVTATDVDASTTLTYSLSGGADQAKFSINSSTGVLTFASAPDYETPTDVGGDNVYDVVVQVSDGSLTDTQAIAVTVTNADEAPVITSNGGGATASLDVAENTTTVTTVTASDVEGNALTYAITGGADQGKFSLNSTTGVLSFVSAPDYETPTDTGGNNVYDVVVQVSDGSLTDTQALAVTVTNTNEAPVITSNGGGATASVNVAENTTAVTTVTASDPDASALTYSITGGADAAKFSLNSTSGVLTFVSAPDYESPTDVGGDNVYDVVVEVSDGSLTNTQTIEVTVTDANEAPVITSDGGGATANVDVAENTTAITTVTATDPDGSSLTYTISGGADAAKFSLNSTSGVLTFVSAPDYESPTDAGGDNIYDVVVEVSDGSLTDTQALAVTATDANEAPVIISDGGGATASLDVAENTTAMTTVTATDVDGGSLTYTISGGADAAQFSLNSSTGILTFTNAPDFETPTDVGANNVYDVVVQVSDGSLTDTQALAVTVTDANEAPVITSNGSGATASLDVAENATAVTTVTATDPDASSLTYALAGGADAATFSLNSTTGVLSFVSAPDYENPTDAGTDNVYDVTVAVSDNSLTDTQALAVTVTDANEAPVITSNGSEATASLDVAENTTAVTTVTASDPDASALTYSISGGANAAKFSLNSTSGALTFVSAPDYESPTDAGGDNVYDVIVEVSDGSLTDTQALAVTVTDANEAPIITSNGGGASASLDVAENTTTVTTVVATDPDASALTYTISGGTDAAKFSLNSATGALAFVAAPDYEAPTDAGANNVYDVVVEVSDGTLTDTQALAVTVTDTNEAPSITSNGGGASASLDVTENTITVTTVTASDVDSGSLTYTISGGADAAKFSLNSSTGALTFVAAPDFESPTDAGANNIYDVVVEVNDGSLTDTQAIAVTVTDANEAPVITSNGGGATASLDVVENTTAVTTVTASDVDSDSLTYTISGGADAATFSLNSSTGALTFVAAPDYDAPTDTGGNNVYEVTVEVSDGSLTDTQAIAVTVTDTNEAPVITSNGGGTTANVEVAEITTAVTTVTATDPSSGSLTYTISGGADAAKFNLNSTSGALTFLVAPDYETPTDTGGNNVYDVVVEVSDGSLTDAQAIAVTVINANEAPVITSDGGGATANLNVEESTTAVTTVTASDVDSGSLTYAISGGADQAQFSINSITGVLTFTNGPDFETPTDVGADNVYEVVVAVSDGSLTDTQALAVTVNVLAVQGFKSVKLTTDADGSEDPTPGDSLTWKVAYANRSGAAVSGFQIRDVLPTGVTVAGGVTVTTAGHGTSAAANGTYTGASAGAASELLAAGATLDANGVITVEIPVTVNVGFHGGLSNQASGISTDLASAVASDNIDNTTTGLPAGVIAPVGSLAQTQTAALAPTTVVVGTLPLTDLAISTTNGVTTVSPGGSTVYTLVVTNNGPANALGAMVTDVFPSAITSATWTCVASTGSSCPASGSGDLNARLNVLNLGTVTFTVTAQIAAHASGLLINTASVSTPSSLIDPIPGNNSATDTDSFTDTADLALMKTSSSDSVNAGANITYTLTLTNQGPQAASNAQIQDAIPLNTTFVSAVANNGGSCSTPVVGSTGLVTCLWSATTAVNATRVVTLVVKVKESAVNGVTIVNMATVSSATTDLVSANNTATAATVIGVAADLGVTKTGPAFAMAGTNVSFTINVTNHGPSVASGVTITDPIPAGLTLVSTTGACTTAFPCTVGTIPVGQSRTIIATYAIPNDYATPTPIQNTATVTSAVADPGPSANSATAFVDIRGPGALTATKTVTDLNGGPAQAGDLLEYTVTLQNSGASDVGGVVFTDFPDINTTLVPNTIVTTQGTVTRGASGAAPVEVEVGSIAADNSVTIVFLTAIHNPLPSDVTRITNQGVVTSETLPALLTDDPATLAAHDATVMFVSSAPALSATKAVRLFVDGDGDLQPSPGDTLLYTVSITNNGNGDVNKVVFSDLPDLHTALVNGSVTTTQGVILEGNDGVAPIVVQVGTLAGNGQSATITFAAQIDPLLSLGVTILRNQGTVSSAETPTVRTDDPSTRSMDDATVTLLDDVPLVMVTQMARVLDDANGDSQPSPGDTLMYTIQIDNPGNRNAESVVVTEVLEPDTALVVGSVQTNQGMVTSGNAAGDTAVHVDIGTVAMGGETVQITFRAVIRPGSLQVSNQAFVNGANFAMVPSDDPVTEPSGDATVTTVSDTPILAATMVASLLADDNGDGDPSPGDTLLYTVTIRNVGQREVTSLVFYDALDVNTTLVAGSIQASAGAVIEQGKDASWLNVGLGPLSGGGATAIVSFWARVNTALPPGVTQVSNQGVVESRESAPFFTDDPATELNSDPTVITVAATPTLFAANEANLYQDRDHNSIVSAGDTLLYTITLRNTGNRELSAVTFSDTPDSKVQVVAHSVRTSIGTVVSGNDGVSPILVQVGTLADGGGTATITFQATIAPTLPSGVVRIINQGTVTSDQLPPQLTDDPHTLTGGDATVVPMAFLDAVKTVTDLNGGLVEPGDTLEYLVTVRNLRGAVTEVVFTDYLPTNAPYVNGSLITTQGSVRASEPMSLTVDLGKMETLQAATLRFRVTVDSTAAAGDFIVNQGFVTSRQTSREFTDADGNERNGNQPTLLAVRSEGFINLARRWRLLSSAVLDQWRGLFPVRELWPPAHGGK